MMATEFEFDSPTTTTAAQSADLAKLIRGNAVARAGRLASMGPDAFRELIESYGGRYTPRVGVAVVLIVIGQHDWPLTSEGKLPDVLRRVRVIRRREAFTP